MRFNLATLLATLVSAACVSAHGYVSNIVINGVSYEGYNPTVFPYESNPPVVVGWTIDDLDIGFVAPDEYGDPDIICHKNATNAGGHATVAAGSKINLQWTPWPSSHHGPVITYLANCGDSCETVDKTTLEFFKIDAVGLVNDAVEPVSNVKSEISILLNLGLQLLVFYGQNHLHGVSKEFRSRSSNAWSFYLSFCP